MGHSYVIMILLGVGLFFGTDYAFADIIITTADNDLAQPGCLDTAVGCYTPNPAIASVGEVITMINTDSAGIHTFTSGTVDGFAASPDGEFDSGILSFGDSFEFVSNIPDVYQYYCSLHVWMQGTIIVQGLSITATVDQGSDTITVRGETDRPSEGITVTVTAPNGNVVAVSQPDLTVIYEIIPTVSIGIFTDTITITQPLWSQQGYYKITAHQNNDPKYNASTEVYINYGEVEPEPLPPTISISVWSDKSSYSEGDIIKISGQVINPTSISMVSILVTAPDGNLVSISQASLNYDHAFSKTMTAGGELMVQSGTYEFKVAYGDVSDTGSFSFSVTIPSPYVPPPTYDTTPPKILKPTNITVDAENSNGARVTFDVIAIDDTDQIVRPTCNPSSGGIFSVGTTTVTCNARDSAGNRAPSVSFSVTVNPLEVAIPDWIKTIASVWCDDKIADSEFISAIQYLIENNIITVSETSSGYGSSQEIPNWVKNNACWWSQNLITGDDFASGIEYLIQQGIIRV